MFTVTMNRYRASMRISEKKAERETLEAAQILAWEMTRLYSQAKEQGDDSTIGITVLVEVASTAIGPQGYPEVLETVYIKD